MVSNWIAQAREYLTLNEGSYKLRSIGEAWNAFGWFLSELCRIEIPSPRLIFSIHSANLDYMKAVVRVIQCPLEIIIPCFVDKYTSCSYFNCPRAPIA